MKNINIWDVLLLPKSLYAKFTERIITLYAGILLVGAVDIVLLQLTGTYKKHFIDKSPTEMTYNIVLFFTMIAFVGFLHMVVFSFPVFDVFKFFKKKTVVVNNTAMLIRLMKIYIIAHLVVIPTHILFRYIELNIDWESSMGLAWLIVLYWSIILPVWFSAIISRGINVIYDFEPQYKSLVFIVVFAWSFLSGIAVNYLVGEWLMQLFK